MASRTASGAPFQGCLSRGLYFVVSPARTTQLQSLLFSASSSHRGRRHQSLYHVTFWTHHDSQPRFSLLSLLHATPDARQGYRLSPCQLSTATRSGGPLMPPP